jgi:anaerobic magnesium-protoporphyrin IX monomethyl ester cyclase
MKVALINPIPMNSDLWNSRPMFSSFAEPLGLLYIAEALKENDYEVAILDHGATNYTFSQVLNWIKNYDPDVLGISVLTRSFLSGIKIAKIAKDWTPDLQIVLGNYHTICAEKIMNKYNFIDYCVLGEGEYSFVKLLDKIRHKDSYYNDIEGLYYRNNGQIKFSIPCTLEQDLDKFSFPDRSLLGNNQYKMSIGGLSISERRSGTIIMSRGCPFQCRFCSVHQRGWRHRSIKNIIEELELLESQNYREIMVMDDNFTLNPKWVIKVCKSIIENKIDLLFHCEGRIGGTEEMYKYMKKANFKSIFFGMESGSQRILDYYNKMITPEKSKLAIKKARRAGIDILMASFILGSPKEQLNDIKKTVDLALKLDIDYAMFHIFEVFPGVAIWDELVSQNKLDEEKYWETGVRVPELPFYNMSIEFLTNIVKNTYKKMYSFSRPRFIMKEIIRSITSKYRREKISYFAKNIHESMRMLDMLSEKRF